MSSTKIRVISMPECEIAVYTDGGVSIRKPGELTIWTTRSELLDVLEELEELEKQERSA